MNRNRNAEMIIRLNDYMFYLLSKWKVLLLSFLASLILVGVILALPKKTGIMYESYTLLEDFEYDEETKEKLAIIAGQMSYYEALIADKNQTLSTFVNRDYDFNNVSITKLNYFIKLNDENENVGLALFKSYQNSQELYENLKELWDVSETFLKSTIVIEGEYPLLEVNIKAANQPEAEVIKEKLTLHLEARTQELNEKLATHALINTYETSIVASDATLNEEIAAINSSITNATKSLKTIEERLTGEEKRYISLLLDIENEEIEVKSGGGISYKKLFVVAMALPLLACIFYLCVYLFNARSQNPYFLCDACGGDLYFLDNRQTKSLQNRIISMRFNKENILNKKELLTHLNKRCKNSTTVIIEDRSSAKLGESIAKQMNAVYTENFVSYINENDQEFDTIIIFFDLNKTNSRTLENEIDFLDNCKVISVVNLVED